jgi:Bax protein
MHRRNPPAIICALLLIFSLTGCSSDPAPVPEGRQPAVIRPSSHDDLRDFMATQNYNWETLDEGVPPFILETLPADLHRIHQLTEKKRIFFLSLLPMVLLANEELAGQRTELLADFADFDQTGSLSAEQQETLVQRQRDFKVVGDPLGDPRIRNELLSRIDIIPASLVLAQAANESAYGTSRFVRGGNSLFGEWTFIPGAGMVPKARPAGETHEVRRFATVYDSLLSYMMNLNTHQAYRSFRRHRAELRAAGLPLRGLDLARGMELYSTRGLDYVEELRTIIRRNRLSLLSGAILKPPPDPVQTPPAAGLLSSGKFSSRRFQLPPAETRAD